MSSRKAIAAAIALAVEKARAGVDYSPRTGATCPSCGAQKLPVRNTKPWECGLRVRFHKCSNPGCLLASLGQTVKSVEVDQTPGRLASSHEFDHTKCGHV